MEIKGRVVLLTGASYGIGKATAELLGREGARVVLAARSVDKLNEIAAGLTDAFVIPTDMTKPDEVRRMVEKTFEHYGRIDVLINNAGQGMHVPVEFADVDDLASIMSLNVYGPLIAMQSIIPIMRKQGGGTIVNISSMVSKAAYPSIGPYASTKCALNMLSLTARKELADDGIVVSLVHPRMTATDFRKNAVQSKVKFTQPQRGMPEIDPPEKVAASILHVIQTGEAEEVVG